MKCPCCEGHGEHRQLIAVDDEAVLPCSACDCTGQIDACEKCKGDGYIELGDQWVDGLNCGGYVATAKDCAECDGTGRGPFTDCDLSEWRPRKRRAAGDIGFCS